MIKMSFSNRTLDRAKLAEEIKRTGKPILYTYGLAYRHPTTYKKQISKEEALRIIKEESLLDANEYDEYIHLNAFSGSDMW